MLSAGGMQMGWKTSLFDLALALLVAVAAIPMRMVRLRSTNRIPFIPLIYSVLKRVGVFPIFGIEPLFDI
jgi:hypothetical protein